MALWISSFLLVFCIVCVQQAVATTILLNSPDFINLTMFEEDLLDYQFNCGFNQSVFMKYSVELNITSIDPFIGSIYENNSTFANFRKSCNNGSAVIHIKSGHIGITNFVVRILFSNSSCNALLLSKYTTIHLSVLRKRTLMDKLTVFVLGPLVLINKCAFGAKIDVDVLKSLLLKPMELALCLFIQFVVMPFIGVFLGYVFNLSPILALALLVSSACPGGGGGYVFSFLINGDITLAISASLLSTIFAMVAMPAVIGLYVLFAGIPNKVHIPYEDILLMLVAIAIPISFGMLIRKKWPELASKLVTVIRPLSWIIILGGLIIVGVTSRYVLYGPRIGIIVAFLLPLSTFFVGITLSKSLCLDWAMAKAISLESGLKNTVLAIAVIELSFPQPQADLAAILIIMITIAHTLSAIVWYFLFFIKSKCTKETKIYYKKAASTDDSEEAVLFLSS